jgi:hypothetical protein
MYKCRCCLRTFDEPREFWESHGFSYGPAERWSVCPYCGESDWDDESTVNEELEDNE